MLLMDRSALRCGHSGSDCPRQRRFVHVSFVKARKVDDGDADAVLCPFRSALQHLERETEPTMREALRVQMMEFGRTPKQLFRKPHPRRRVAVTGGTPAASCGCFGGSSTAQPARPAANVLHPTFVQVVLGQLPHWHSRTSCVMRTLRVTEVALSLRAQYSCCGFSLKGGCL